MNSSYVPIPKIRNAGITGGLTAGAIYLLTQQGIEVTPQLASLVTLGATVIAGYLTPPIEDDKLALLYRFVERVRELLKEAGGTPYPEIMDEALSEIVNESGHSIQRYMYQIKKQK